MSIKRAYEDAKMDLYGQEPHHQRPGDPACQWCEEPSTATNPVKEYKSEIGTKLFRHEQCEKESSPNNYFNPVENYIASSRKIAVYPMLVCDNPHCDSDYDVGDDNETDSRQVVGEPCWECGRGQLEYKTAGQTSIYNYTNPYVNPAKGQGALERLPKKEEPSAPMEQGGGNLDANLDDIPPQNGIPIPPGTGRIPNGKSAKTSYDDLKYHLIHHHGFRHDWLQGYNPKVLLKLHLKNHDEKE